MAVEEWMPQSRGSRPVRERKRLLSTLSLLQGSETADETLAPQSVTGVFDEAFDLYKRHFIVFITIASLVLLPIQVACYAAHAVWLQKFAADVMSANNSGSADPGDLALMYLGYFLIGEPRRGIPGVFTFCVPFLVSGPMSVAVSDTYLGRQPSVRSAYRSFRSYLVRLTGSYMLAGSTFIAVLAAGTFLILMVLGVVATIMSTILPEAVAVLALVMLLIPYLTVSGFVAKYFALTTPIAVLEGAPPLFVTGRNNQLVGKLRFRATFLAMTFLPVLIYGLQAVLLASANSAFEQFPVSPALQFMIQTCVGAGAICFMQPYWMVFVTLLYYDYRIKRECFDIRILSARLEEMPPVLPVIVAPQPAMSAQQPAYSPSAGAQR